MIPGYYRDTIYGRAGGVLTHSYDELCEQVRAQKEGNGRVVASLFPPDSPLMDPYRDGKAIERFRETFSSRLLMTKERQIKNSFLYILPTIVGILFR